MNRTFTLCFSLYPIALPFGYVLIYTFYHYAVPDANSNFKVTNYAENLKFSSTIKSYNNTNKRSAHVITLLNGIQIVICNSDYWFRMAAYLCIKTIPEKCYTVAILIWLHRCLPMLPTSSITQHGLALVSRVH